MPTMIPKRNGGRRTPLDAIVVGAGPNGLAAAITIAREGYRVRVYELGEEPGGGLRSAELTEPGFVHDRCAAIHPLGAGSPVFRSMGLDRHGLEWVHPDIPLAHALDDGDVVTLERSVERTAAGLGPDGDGYTNLVAPLVDRWDDLEDDVLGPPGFPSHPIAMAAFGRRAIRGSSALGEATFDDSRGRALIAGLAAHSFLPLDRSLTGGVALVLAILGHTVGWPLARGGSQRFADALVAELTSLGGEIVTGIRVRTVDELPAARATLFDITPRQLVSIAGDRLPTLYRRRLEAYRYGPAAFKMDWALDGPIPWSAPDCARAATVHVGGTAAEIAASEAAVWRREHPARPFVLLAQPSLFDATRAPAGHHTVWAYCHVPNASRRDVSDRIEAQIERFAPGFGERVIARHVTGPAALEAYNPNYVGGDINGGVMAGAQALFRPIAKLDPYRVPGTDLYLCSSSTPPGGGVHGMCGYHAARSALRRSLR